MKIKMTGNKKTAVLLASSFQQFFQTEPQITSAGGGTGEKEKVIVHFDIKDSKVHQFLSKIGRNE